MAEVESSLAVGGGEIGGVCEGSDGADGGACVCRSQRKATIKRLPRRREPPANNSFYRSGTGGWATLFSVFSILMLFRVFLFNYLTLY